MSRITTVAALVLVFALPAFAATEAELGTIEFPTSANSPEAQKHFLHGVLLLHSFTFESAENAFRQAIEAEPGFVMGYWGEALSHNHPLIPERDPETPRKVLERLAPTLAERLAKAPTERERGFLEAVELLFGEGTEAERTAAYADRMGELAARYPDDTEVQALYSVALLAKWAKVGDPDFRIRMKAGAIAQEIFREHPNHPGAAHYVIHSFDDPIHAPLALAAAKRYADIAPDAAHALHMPSHIFIQHGMWDRVVASNEASYESAIRLWQKREALSETEKYYNDVYVWHALDWGQYGSLQLGDYEKSREAIELLRPVADKSKAPMAIHGPAEMTARQIIETEQWEILPITETSIGAELLATGMSAAHTGDVATAERAEAALKQRYDAKKGSDKRREEESSQTLAIMTKEVGALVRLARGQGDEAVRLMEEAIAIEERRELPNGAANPPKPAHELYGEILLELGRAAEAVAAFETSLERMPNRTRSLRGLARAAAKSGDQARAREAYEALERNLIAHPELPGYQEAKGFLTKTEES